MQVTAENLANVLFDLYLAYDRNPYSSELHDQIADIEIISSDEDDVVAAVAVFHDLIAEERRKRH
jgi:hypothetical protein